MQSLGATIFIKNEIDRGNSVYTIVAISERDPSELVKKKFMGSYLSNNLNKFISSIDYYLDARITRKGVGYITCIDMRRVKKDKIRNKLIYRLSNFAPFQENRYYVNFVSTDRNRRNILLPLNIEEYSKLLNRMISNANIKRLTKTYSEEKEVYIKVVGDSIEIGYKEPETT